MTSKPIVGQGAIEYLLIIGAAILIVAVIIIALTNVTTSGTDNINEENVQSTLNPLQQLVNNQLNTPQILTILSNDAPLNSPSQTTFGEIGIRGNINQNMCIDNYLMTPEEELIICENGCSEDNGYGEYL